MSPASPLLTTVLDLLLGIGALRQRKMFGGIYIYCDDLFIATIHDDKLYFKANAQTAGEFIARRLPIFSYPKGSGVATLQYYQAPPEVFTGRAAMKKWAGKALLAAKEDVAKKPNKKASAKRPDVTLKKKARSAK
jgi:DNA transformation protein and related proteins